MFQPIHLHLIATAVLRRDFVLSERDIRDWLVLLVDEIGMHRLDGPLTCRCDDPGNEGVTGMVLLSTSHASIHSWYRGARDPRAYVAKGECGPDEHPYVQFDLYSRREFDAEHVMALLAELCDLIDCSFQVIDRSFAKHSAKAPK